MKLQFKKASRKQSKLRLLLSGLSGSGKTYSSLLIASGLGEKIAFIDTERGSASLYSDLIDFDVLELPDFSVDTYISAINQAVRLNYDVIIIDSVTHAWDLIKEDADKYGKGGNSWSGWAHATPIYKKFIDAIVSCNAHIIACARAKTQWGTEEYESHGRLKIKPVRIGLAPEQKGNIEYEFTLAATLDNEHNACFIKDRTSKFLDKVIKNPGYDLGVELLQWLNEGEEIKKVTPEQLVIFDKLIKEIKAPPDRVQMGLDSKGFSKKEDMTEEAAQEWIDAMQNTIQTRLEKEKKAKELGDVGM